MARSTVAVRFTGDAADLKRSIGDVEGRLSGIGGKIGGFAKAAAIGLGAVAVGAGVMAKGFVDAAVESQKVTKQTEAVIKSMGGIANVTAEQVANLSEKLSMQTGVDDELIQSGQNVLLTFGNVQNAIGDGPKIFDRATQAALDMSVALGTDMSSASMMVGKALNDPIRGLTALRRSGIQFTKQQEDQIKKMVEAGDVAGAQAIMLKELETQFGGSAEAQATAGDKLKVVWGNLQEQLGEKLLPIFEKVAAWLAKTLPRAIEKVAPVLQEIIGGFQAFVAAFQAGDGDITSAGFPGFMERAAFIARQAFDAISEKVREWGPIVADAITNFGGAVLGWWQEHGPSITEAVKGLAEDFNTYLLQPMQAVATFVVEELVPKIGQIVTWIADNEGVLQAFGTLIGVTLVAHYVKLATQAVISAATQAGAWVVTHTQAIASATIHGVQVALMIGHWVALAAKAVAQAAIIVGSWIATTVAATAADAKMVVSAVIQGGAWAGLAAAAETSAARIAKAWLAALGPAAAVVAAAETINELTGQKMNPNKLSLWERLDPRKAFDGMSFSLPGFDDGGVIPGPIGKPRVVLAHGGETVLPTHKTGMAGASVQIDKVVMQAATPAQLRQELEFMFAARGL